MRWVRRVGPLGLVITLLSFSLNYGWEMAQMPAFTDRTGQPFHMSVAEAMLHCLVPTLGDMVIVMSSFVLGALIYGRFDWIRTLGWRDVVLVSIPLVLLAMVIEFVAVDRPGRWHYRSLMPLVPVVQVGLLPTIQLAFLTLLTFTLGGWIIKHWDTLDQHRSSQTREHQR